jgi:DNA-binding CsgD family transcriptional regulator
MTLPKSGLLIVDSALNPVASDEGAANILGYGRERDGASANLALPVEIIEAIRNRPPADLSCVTVLVPIGNEQYRCRCYHVPSENPGLRPGIHALHFEADTHPADPIRHVASQYRLTEREEEALRGIALGLTTKELADRMNISPNTVKAFVHLIMIKLGVTTRTAIIAKVFDNRSDA